MSRKELSTSRELLEVLIDYYDDSQLQPPIQVGDDRHKAICEYRQALPSHHLPPGEGDLMRLLLEWSRTEEIDKRRESQSAAEQWARLLLLKYPSLRVDGLQAEQLDVEPPRTPENLTQAQSDIWTVVVEHHRRMGRKEIAEKLVAKGLGQNVSTLKANLAILSRRLKVLPYRADTQPPGYGLPDGK